MLSLIKRDYHKRGATCMATALFLTASDVSFADDMKAWSNSPRDVDATDIFYVSRLNDPSTYFFTWYCKRYHLTLKPSPMQCPICLETVTNSIQLSCGHTFCRMCLATAAENELSSCALCRKSHILNPEILREQFNAQRRANVSWRLGLPTASKSFSKFQWELPRAEVRESISPKSSPSRKQQRAKGKKCDSCDFHAAADLGKSSAWDIFGTDIGAFSSADLNDRWNTLMGFVVAPEEDAGDLETAALSSRLLQTEVGEITDKDIGAESLTAISERWASIKGLSDCGADCGDLSVEAMSKRWQGVCASACISGVDSQESQALLNGWEEVVATSMQDKDVGALSASDLSTRWNSLVGLACMPEEVGSCSLNQLQNRWSESTQLIMGGQSDIGAEPLNELAGRLESLMALAGSQEVGGLSGKELKGRLGCLDYFLGSNDAGGVSLNEFPARMDEMDRFVNNNDVGGIFGEALASRLETLVAMADVGALSTQELLERHEQLAWLWKTSDVGALSLPALSAKISCV